MTTPASSSSPALQAYARHVDGLFTYCLSVLCEHNAATAAVAEVRDLVLRHGARLAEPSLRRAWLYALARHACLDRLERGLGPAEARASQAQSDQRRRELASLAWPEAAGTEPEQREALELAVRHRLSTPEVAAVLGRPVEVAQALLAAAGTEVGRTRTALLVLGVGSCPELAKLGGVGAESWRGWVLGPALRRELVQHVVDCPTCRGTAERVAGELGTELSTLPGLPLIAAPVTVRIGGTSAGRLPGGSAGAAFLAGAAAGRRAVAPKAYGRPEPRFDQRGFPRHRAPSTGRALATRQRTVATGVLAVVLAAPVVALWGAHRTGGAPSAAASVSSVRVDTEPRQDAAPAPVPPPAPIAAPPPAAGLRLVSAVNAETSLPGPRLPMLQGPAVPVPSKGATAITSPTLAQTFTPPPVAPPAAGRLTVEAGEYGNRTVLTLTNSGGTALQWAAATDADWLRLSRDGGTLEPGQRITVTVTVDEQRVPQGHWTARITLSPSDSVVTVEGGPSRRSGGGDGGTPSGAPSGAPSGTPSGAPSSSGGPSPSGSASPTPTGSPTATPSGTPSTHPSTGPSGSPSPTATHTP